MKEQRKNRRPERTGWLHKLPAEEDASKKQARNLSPATQEFKVLSNAVPDMYAGGE